MMQAGGTKGGAVIPFSCLTSATLSVVFVLHYQREAIFSQRAKGVGGVERTYLYIQYIK